MKLLAVDRALISAVAYADVFDWPLRLPEVRERAVGRVLTETEAERHIGYLVSLGILKRRGGYVFLPGRVKSIHRRLIHERQSERKIRIASRVARVLGRIPTVKAVFVTGGVAAGNADHRDDIDLLIVADANAVWMTRLATTVLVDHRFIRRHPGAPEEPDAICLNMFMSENAMSVPAVERDVYCAYELLMAKPVFDRDGSGEKLVRSNPWIHEFLPNWQQKSHLIRLRRSAEDGRMGHLVRTIFRLMEPVAYIAQLVYMKKRTTSEVLRPEYVRFHPVDARGWILPAWKKRIAQASSYLTKNNDSS